MKLVRAFLALVLSFGFIAIPVGIAKAAVTCAAIGPGAGGFAITGTPSETGTVGVPYSSQISTDAGAFVTATGALPPGLTAGNTGALLDNISITGTPTTAGSYNISLDIKIAADAYQCSWTFVINAAGGGAVLEPTLTVGDPIKGGEFAESKVITCTSSTFSITPSRIRIYFTKNNVEISDDPGSNVTSIDTANSSGIASLLLTEDLIDSTIGCTVYAKSGTSEKTATATWGTLVATPVVRSAMEISEDSLRNGGLAIFENPAAASLVSDGFVGGRYQITGKSLNTFTFTLQKSDGRKPTQTPLASEQQITVLSRTSTKAVIQLPEATNLGQYFIIARTPTQTTSIPISILKPILTIASAKALINKNRFLLEGDKVYGNTYTTTSDIAVLSSNVGVLFKRDFPGGFKLAFIKNSEFLADATIASLKKLAKMSLSEIVITGYGFKGGTQKINQELAKARAETIAKVLANAGLKNAKVLIQTEQFDKKYSRQAEVSIR